MILRLLCIWLVFYSTHIYFPFLSKIPASESPPGSPVGPLWIEIPAYRAFYISLYLKVPEKRASLHVPQKQGLCGNRCPFQSLNISFGVPSKGPLTPGPLMESPQRERGPILGYDTM
jgi:hypothetical protein